jgi:hypothetical protein
MGLFSKYEADLIPSISCKGLFLHCLQTGASTARGVPQRLQTGVVIKEI